MLWRMRATDNSVPVICGGIAGVQGSLPNKCLLSRRQVTELSEGSPKATVKEIALAYLGLRDQKRRVTGG